ncbi:DUF397 domain-containing protein [Streptomyces chattanoogensis]
MQVDIPWRKSSFSEQGDNCLELTARGGEVLVRESDDPSVVLKTTRARLSAFLASAKAGKFDDLT